VVDNIIHHDRSMKRVLLELVLAIRDIEDGCHVVNGFAIKAKWNLIGRSRCTILPTIDGERALIGAMHLIARIAGKNGGITGFYQR